MITAKEIKEFLDTPIYMTRQELIELMDEEIDKGPDEMDTDLVEELVELIIKFDEEEKMASEPLELPNTEIIEIPEQTESGDEKDNDKKDDRDNPKIITFGRNLKFRKIAAVAAAACLIIATTAGASAHFFDFNIAEELVEYFSNHLKIKQEGGTQNADSYSLTGSALAQELENNGISPVTLPAALLTDDWRIEEISCQKNDIASVADIKIVKGDSIVLINLSQYTDKVFMMDRNISYPEKGEQVEVNGLSVIVFNLKNQPYAIYQDGLTEYSISLNCDYDTTMDIVKTIQ